MLKVSADWFRSRRLTVDAGGLAAQRVPPVGADHEPRATAIWPLRGRERDDRVVAASIAAASSSNPRQIRTVRPRAPPALRSASGFRCCSRTRRDRSRSQANRTSGARISRPVSSTSRMTLQRRRLVAAARPDIRAVRADRPSRPAAPWCGCRHRAARRASRAVRAPASASAIAAARPAGPPPTTTAS